LQPFQDCHEADSVAKVGDRDEILTGCRELGQKLKNVVTNSRAMNQCAWQTGNLRAGGSDRGIELPPECTRRSDSQ
jgi:hypothetical protein